MGKDPGEEQSFFWFLFLGTQVRKRVSSEEENGRIRNTNCCSDLF